MGVTLNEMLPQLESTQVDITIHISTKLNVTQASARRKVNVFVLSEIGTGLGGGDPTLAVDKERLCWRVPIILALPTVGNLGQVGEIDVDAQTGEILADTELIQTIAHHAERLFAGSTL
ncbi:MAG: hypothetical protein JXA33_20390 [Anaerolineae bacterium]|nr:hypothetical protein [Anaerolineae bacterium]